jgi:hypothetical protein
LKIGEWFFEVPVDYAKPNKDTLRLFARSAEKVESPAAAEKEKEKKQLPWFLYLEGGPGCGCWSPQSYSWVHTVLDKGYQVRLFFRRLQIWSFSISISSFFAYTSNCHVFLQNVRVFAHSSRFYSSISEAQASVHQLQPAHSQEEATHRFKQTISGTSVQIAS